MDGRDRSHLLSTLLSIWHRAGATTQFNDVDVQRSRLLLFMVFRRMNPSFLVLVYVQLGNMGFRPGSVGIYMWAQIEGITECHAMHTWFDLDGTCLCTSQPWISGGTELPVADETLIGE